MTKKTTLKARQKFNPDGDGGKFTPRDRAMQAAAGAIARRALRNAKLRGDRSPQSAPGVPLPDNEPEPDKDGEPNYWCDVSERVLFATRALLFAFVEWELYNPKNVQIDWEWTAAHREARRTIDSLYLFFKTERPKREREITRLQDRAYKMSKKAHGGEWLEPAEPGALTRRKKPNPAAVNALYKQAHKLEDKLDKDTTEALCRVMRVRGFLWT